MEFRSRSSPNGIGRRGWSAERPAVTLSAYLSNYPGMATTTLFDRRFAALPSGYSEGTFENRRYGVTVKRSLDARRNNLFARELGGSDFVSFNLFHLQGRTLLKPCEMATEKVTAFVLNFHPDPKPPSASQA